MKKVYWAIILTILVTAVLYFVTSKNKGGKGLVGSGLVGVEKSLPTPSASPASPVAPTTFQFDSSTDLKAELEKVNPQVLDSDFE